MNIDELRRAWQAASEASGVDARLVAASDDVLRGRTEAPWKQRLRFETALADALPDQVDLQWLAPRVANPRDRARGRLGLAPEGPREIGSKKPDPATRAAGKAPLKAGPTPVPGAKRVLAVASGKGGVGKSTVAVNIALSMKAQGWCTGLLDADVYGPSIPTMLGAFSAPTKRAGRFEPAVGPLPFLSLGLMVNPDQSVMWRGPLVQRMVRDLLQATDWPDLDCLVIDLPPGTGDVQLSLVQRSLLTGAVIVTTPQDIALIDAARGLQMFQATDVPVLGIVENMASWTCPHCGALDHPFGLGGGEREAERLGVPFLGRVPLDEAVRRGGDAGEPVVHSDPGRPSAEALAAIATRLMGALA